MPTLIPEYWTLSNGHEISYDTLYDINIDLARFGWITVEEYEITRFWLRQAQNRLAMPGNLSFRCVYTGEKTNFVRLIDGYNEMYILAANWFDITVDETDDESEDSEALNDSRELLRAFPENIGRFNMNPQYFNVHDEVGVDEDIAFDIEVVPIIDLCEEDHSRDEVYQIGWEEI